jgi:polynucleotide 5'-kinase involved in rRNA processing
MSNQEQPKRRMYHEAPSDEIWGPLCSTAEAIVEWINAEERCASGPWVAGLYGGRDTGKTSLLLM